MNSTDPYVYWRLPRRLLVALLAYAKARRSSAVIDALPFDHWGRMLGLRKMLRGEISAGCRDVVNPIALVRYFEFAFCHQHLVAVAPHTLLDISSPRLFPLYIACRRPDLRVVMINPDPGDLAETRDLVRILKLKNVELINLPLDLAAARYPQTFDCVCSISVIEHIAGAYDDTGAVRMMYSCLKPGGRLLLTFPLSEQKQHEDEYLAEGGLPYEGTHQVQNEKGCFFFQRLYSSASIRERLLAPLGNVRVESEWWGEKTKGYYRQFSRSGKYNLGWDIMEFAKHFQRYPTFEAMPGLGVCGLAIGADIP